MNRRRFLKLVGSGVAAAGVSASGIKLLAGRINSEFPVLRRPAFVDYNQIPEEIETPVLKIAQWYGYWPRQFLENFRAYIRDRYQVAIDYEQAVYASNEELLNWITVGGKTFDVMFPSNGMVELMDRLGLIYNLNLGWLPNFYNLFAEFRSDDPSRLPAEWRIVGSHERYLRAVPYQWGTTGIGVNTRQIRIEDVRAAGWECFLWDTYQTKEGSSVDFRGTKMMTLLNDMREVITLGLKLSGWSEQLDQGKIPTGVAHTRSDVPQDLDAKDPRTGQRVPILNLSDYRLERQQWSNNDYDADRIERVKSALLGVRPRLLAYESSKAGEYLAEGITYLSHAWNGDILFTARPYAEKSSGRDPIDYVVPEQGSTRWIDNVVVHSASRNLWLAHEFINFILDGEQGALITDWTLYGTPNEEAYARLKSYEFLLEPWDPRSDHRIYLESAMGYDPTSHPEGHISDRLEYQVDVGLDVVYGRYLPIWEQVRY